LRPKGISVIIPNYNGSQLLNEILPSVTQALFATGLPNEIIISDDCSTDDSVKMIAENYPEIILIESTTNKGFSPTINKGIFASKYEYLLLLNNDVKLEADYFKPLLRYFELPDTFGVMGRIIGWNDNRIQDGGKYPEFHGAKIKTSGNYIPVSDTHNGYMYSMYLSGANALVSGEKLIQLGGFDELFAPFYVEDFELSLRAWRLGWKCYYEHEAICRHKLSVTIKSKNKKKYINRIYYRNKMYLHAIHLEGIELFFWYLQLFPEIAIRLLSGRFYFLQSVTDFLSTLKKMKASKSAFNQLASAKGKLISFKETVKTIQQSLSEKNIKRF
jgi:GT2 family glycosyltransferase